MDGRSRAGRTIASMREVIEVSARVGRVRVPETFPRERVVLGELHLVRNRLEGVLDEIALVLRQAEGRLSVRGSVSGRSWQLLARQPSSERGDGNDYVTSSPTEPYGISRGPLSQDVGLGREAPPLFMRWQPSRGAHELT
jgi:hypothetical protein